MSATSTISHSNLHHLYEELLNEEVWLRTDATQFEASLNSVTVQLRPEVLDAIARAHSHKVFPHQRNHNEEQKT